MYYVYKIQNILTDEIVYIGYTGTSLRSRFNSHKARDDKRKTIFSYINEHGKKNFFIAAIDRAETKEDAVMKEMFWTKFFMARCDTLLNKNIGNEHTSSKGVQRSEDIRRKISIARKGMVFTDKHRKNISISHTGLMVGANHPNAKKTMLVNTGEVFETLKAAGEKYSVSFKNIQAVCAGKRNYAGKLNGIPMIWKYVE